MNANQDHLNEDEFEAKVQRILEHDADEIGVRVERDGVADWQEVGVAHEGIAFADGASWLAHAHAHPQAQAQVDEHGDPPSVLLYDKRQLAVRDDVLPDLAALGIDVDARKNYPGLVGGWIVAIPDGDPYHVMSQFYEQNEHLRSDAPPIGQYDPHREHRTLDAVSLIHHYLTMSHVFFWPQNQKSHSNAVLQAAPNGDDRVVVVLDTGINPDHTFLANGPGQVDYLRSQAEDDEWIGAGYNAGHGTGVAAVVRQHNGTATILGARVQLGQGQNNTVEETQSVAAIDQVAARFADDPRLVVLNLSFGGPVQGTSALYVKLQEFVAANRRVVAAAGNVNGVNDRRPMQPAAWPHVYAVASRTPNGRIHEWSNYNTPGFVWVDTARNGDVNTADGTTPAAIVHWRGTSFSAPQIAATI